LATRALEAAEDALPVGRGHADALVAHDHAAKAASNLTVMCVLPSPI